MKRIIVFGMIFILMSISLSNIYAQEEKDAIIANLSNLFNYSKSKNFDKAAALIAYEGENKNRVQKDTFNASDKDELNQVKRICKKISALIELATKYEFNPVTAKVDNGTNIYSIDVSFISGDQKLVTSFSFVKTEKGFLLSNMN